VLVLLLAVVLALAVVAPPVPGGVALALADAGLVPATACTACPAVVLLAAAVPALLLVALALLVLLAGVVVLLE